LTGRTAADAAEGTEGGGVQERVGQKETRHEQNRLYDGIVSPPPPALSSLWPPSKARSEKTSKNTGSQPQSRKPGDGVHVRLSWSFVYLRATSKRWKRRIQGPRGAAWFE
jgi:hypothetical protein